MFNDQFLIADIRLKGDLPKERRFWFYPSFHPTNSVLLHRQADDILRVDFQLGRDADAEEEKKPESIDRRLRQMFGPDARWEHEWSSVYTFTCRMMERFVHGRVIFAGDAAHVVSPFGARGGNAAVADADNLAWKLACVVAGKSPPSLLDTYCSERRAAEENIRQSTRSTDFITPKFEASRRFRDATLALAKRLSVRQSPDQQRPAVGADGAYRLAARHARRRRRLDGRPGRQAGDDRCADGRRLADRRAGAGFRPAELRPAGSMQPTCRSLRWNAAAWRRGATTPSPARPI